MNNNDDSEILTKSVYSVLKDMKSLDSDISHLVDEYFWDLVYDLMEDRYRYGRIIKENSQNNKCKVT